MIDQTTLSLFTARQSAANRRNGGIPARISTSAHAGILVALIRDSMAEGSYLWPAWYFQLQSSGD